MRVETRVLEATGEFQVGSDYQGETDASASIPVTFQNAQLPAPGSYSYELYIDGDLLTTVPFIARQG